MVLSSDDVNIIVLDMQYISLIKLSCIFYLYNSLNWLLTSNWYKYPLVPANNIVESSVNLQFQTE